jgi:hypothetical protein
MNDSIDTGGGIESTKKKIIDTSGPVSLLNILSLDCVDPSDVYCNDMFEVCKCLGFRRCVES